MVARRWLGAAGMLRGRGATSSFAAGAATTGVGVLTGVILARVLGPFGRGELTSILIAPTLAGFLFGLGAASSIAYLTSRTPHLRGELMATWLTIAACSSVLAVMALELWLWRFPLTSGSAANGLARWWAATVFVALVTEVFAGFLLADVRYAAFNTVRVIPPLTAAVLYAALALVHRMTVPTVLAANAAGLLLALAVAGILVLRRGGLLAFDRALLTRSLWFGARAQSHIVGGLVNARLDILVMSVVLAAAPVGYYSVAANISWVVFTASAGLAAATVPETARNDGTGRSALAPALRATLVASIAMVVVGVALAPVAITLAYGPQFAPSAPLTQILLPGTAFLAASNVVTAAITGLGRPGVAAMTQVPGVVITAAGLGLYLRSGGATAAALVSTAAYFALLVAALVAHRRVTATMPAG